VINYFQLFDIEMSFEVNAAALTKQFYALSKQWHPDKYTLSNASEQALAMQKSTDINAGFKILKNEQTRIRHILSILNAEPEEGKEKMPQDFLMSMMDINEAIMDHKMDPSADGETAIKNQLDNFSQELKTNFDTAVADFDFQNPSEEKLDIIKDYYLKSKYLKRLLDNVSDREVEM